MIPFPKISHGYNTKKSLTRGISGGALTILAYIVIVVITTPGLAPPSAIKAAFGMNSVIIFGTAIAVGLQFFISSYSRAILGCRLDKKGNNKGSGIIGSSSTTAISSFFSFFSLVPLGCCGSWLLILSLLPSVFGGSLSVAIIQYSKPLSYIGLAIVFGFAALSGFKLKRELKQMGRKSRDIQRLKEKSYSRISTARM
jgi:hypothetical protein